MSTEKVETKSELMAEIGAAWNELTARLNELSRDQMSGPTDAQDWTVVDHITHLAAWERSVASLLQGGSRHAGLGVEEALYRTAGFDEINAAIQRREAGASSEDAIAQLGEAHAALLTGLAPLNDEQLKQPTDAFSPAEARPGGAPRTLDVIFGNTAAHYREHLEWIEAILE